MSIKNRCIRPPSSTSKLRLDGPLEEGNLKVEVDGKFTVEFVECLAGCGTAPVMMCNEDFYEGVSNTKADEILARCK